MTHYPSPPSNRPISGGGSVPPGPSERSPLNRRDFLKTTGALTAGAALSPYLGCIPGEGSLAEARVAAEAGWIVRPFRLDRVSLGAGVFRDKRDRMLNYARRYGGDTDMYGGPDRLLSIFRANAGLDTRGAEPVGSWENATGYLRGHYAGHFMSMLAQAYAGTGDETYKQKLDYMVAALAECQEALAAAARLPTPRVPGRHGGALWLSGSPIGLAEHVHLPQGIVRGLNDFTIALWISPSVYDREAVSDPRRDTVELIDQSAVFSFGSPNPEYAGAPLTHMYLTVRVSNDHPVPRFAITTNGEEGEQHLDGMEPLPLGQWTHIAVARTGGTGTLFINGVPVAANPAMTLGPADLGIDTDNWLGRHQFPQRNISYLNASLDEFQIFGRALGEEEIRSLLDSPGGTVGGGDVVWYRFDEVEGPTAVDSSGNGRDATIIAPTDGRRHPGFLSAYPETQFMRLEEFARYGGSQGIWAPYYTLHKIMAGLIDAHVHAGNRQALDVLTGIGDWVHSRLSPLRQEQLDRMWDIYIAGEYGGVNESLATLHALRPDKAEYLEAAGRFVNNNVYAPTVANEDALDGRHANQHIPQFTGYLRIYEQGHDADYFAAARNFWGMVVPHRIYSHGGLGVGEMLRARDVIAGSLFQDRNHAETCPLYNMLKLSRNLFFHEADPKYMDYYELGLFNQMLGSRRDMDSTESPEVTYFVPVQPGQRRSYGNVGTCCGGTGMESHTKYQDSIYFRSVDDSALFVNLYISSKLEWPEKGFTVTQESQFPEEGVSILVVHGSGQLDIRLRVPGWVRQGFMVRINGELQGLDAIPGTYLNLSRRWASGDTIQIETPFSFRVERAIDDPSVQSIYYGPILLAAQAEPVGEDLESGLLGVSFYPYLKLDGDLAAAMTTAGRPLHFTTQGLTLAPFFVADPAPPAAGPTEDLEEESQGRERRGPPTQPYHIYLRRAEPRIVFGSVDSGVPNPAGPDGLTFLDVVWDAAPFPSHGEFLATVGGVAGEWAGRGVFSSAQEGAIMSAARRAEEDLRI
jgi:DUF1680 family protein